MYVFTEHETYCTDHRVNGCAVYGPCQDAREETTAVDTDVCPFCVGHGEHVTGQDWHTGMILTVTCLDCDGSGAWPVFGPVPPSY